MQSNPINKCKYRKNPHFSHAAIQPVGLFTLPLAQLAPGQLSSPVFLYLSPPSCSSCLRKSRRPSDHRKTWTSTRCQLAEQRWLGWTQKRGGESERQQWAWSGGDRLTIRLQIKKSFPQHFPTLDLLWRLKNADWKIVCRSCLFPAANGIVFPNSGKDGSKIPPNLLFFEIFASNAELPHWKTVFIFF